MALALIQMITVALSLWQNAEKQKYLDQNMSLEAQYHDEINKPVAPTDAAFIANPKAYRNNASVDYIEFQLRNLSSAISTSIAGQSTRS